MTGMWLRRLFPPKPVRVAARAARADRPDGDPAVRDALQLRAQLLRYAAGTAGYGVFTALALRALVPAWREAVALPMIALLLGHYRLARPRDRAMHQAVAQWPALAAQAEAPPVPVRLRPPAPWHPATLAGLAGLPVLLAAELRDPGLLLPDWPSSAGFLATVAQVAVVLCAGLVLVLHAALLLWLVDTVHTAWRRGRRPVYLELDAAGVRLPTRGLEFSWAQVTEVAVWPRAAPTGLALRVRHPVVARRGEWRSIGDRIMSRAHRPDGWVAVGVVDVREPLLPAYRAALAFHAAHGEADAAARRGSVTAFGHE
ncbi:hypothetical protein [Catellatospora sp. NPDC049609]|uniref:hypothetical protein n=1 Tax=Catellatospora sp. NPDC049609 TaxID=3155505 RepID=UPI003446A992